MIYKLISPILGAIIGYFTNWLAIKMLFLPRKPKYIGKFRVPFTPGLIPKEREKLSKKIAKVFEENILNKETIEKNLFTEQNKEKVYLLIKKNWDNLIEKDYEIKDIIEKISQDDVFLKLENEFFSYIEKYLNNEKNQNDFSTFLTNKLVYFIKNIDKYDNIKDIINKIIISITYNENIKLQILNKRLNEIISQEDISKIKFAIFENIPKISECIVDKLQSNIELNNKLKEIVKKIIEENIGGFAGLFLNSDKIYESIKNNIIINIRDSENQTAIGIKIFEYISSYQNKKLEEMYNDIPNELKDLIKGTINKENFEKIINKNLFEKYFKEENLYNTIEKVMPSFEQKISEYIKKFINNDLKKNIISIFKNIFKSNKEKILALKINLFLNKINLENYKDNIFNCIEKFIEKEGNKIISEVNIADMVENKINSFDVIMIENIIISVAKKELNAITIIGGILGFIIGLIPIFYS